VDMGSSVAGAGAGAGGGAASEGDHQPLRLLAHEGCRERIGERVGAIGTHQSVTSIAYGVHVCDQEITAFQWLTALLCKSAPAPMFAGVCSQLKCLLRLAWVGHT
jgi:hypothetical protein